MAVEKSSPVRRTRLVLLDQIPARTHTHIHLSRTITSPAQVPGNVDRSVLVKIGHAAASTLCFAVEERRVYNERAPPRGFPTRIIAVRG